jgi:hypothetical protein
MFLERSNKAKTSAVHGFNDLLCPSAVADGFTRRHDAVAQDGLVDEWFVPELLEQLLSGDGAIAVLHEIGKYIEHLGLDPEQGPGTAQLIALRIEFIIPKGVDHPLSLLLLREMRVRLS